VGGPTPERVVASATAEDVLSAVADEKIVARASHDTFDIWVDLVRLARLAVARSAV